MSKVSKSRLDGLLDALVEMMFMEIEFCRKIKVPMAAADKTVIVTLLKNNAVTASPDEAKLDALAEEFSNVTKPELKAKGLALISEAKASYLS